jgi:hypothetical protein
MDHPDIIEQVREYQERIISGEITIPDPMQQ